jgi:plasmid stabilization system protein ParE
MYKLIIRPEAQADLDEAVQWYEDHAPGKSEELILEVREKLQRLVVTPEMHMLLRFGVRRSNLKRFPYSLVYRTNKETMLVEILAFVHFRQSNTHWITRIN